VPGPRVGARPGWQAQLELAFERRAGTTVLADRRHSGPLIVQRPFYPEGEVCHVYVVHPPGGVVAGDELALGAQVRPGAHALLTTPAAGKFYRSEGATARLTQDFTVEAGILEWLPQESIFYPGASALVRATIRLRAAARFFGWEVSCLGLPASAAPFHTGELRQHLDVWFETQLLLTERQHIDREVIAARWGLAGNAAIGTLLAFPATQHELAAARTAAGTDTVLGCTLVDGVLVCRALAQRGDRLRQAFVEIWSKVRPLLLGRESMSPRVWAT